MQGNNMEYWQKMAGLYEPFMKKNQKMYNEICKEIVPLLNRNMNVLELACGTGQLSFPLAPETAHWDATNLPYANNSFDAVMIANALHIMPEPEKALHEIYRVLKTGGYLFAPTFVQLPERKEGLRMKLLKLTGFKTYHKWNAGELNAFISAKGFAVQRHRLIEGFQPLCCVIACK